MIIRQMALRDLNQAIELHRQSLPHTLSSKMGSKYLRYLYTQIINHGETHPCFVVAETDKIVGVITSTKNLKFTQNIINPLKSFNIVLVVLKKLLKRKITFTELFNKLFFEIKLLKKFQSPYASILTLFINQGARKKGLGKRLVKATLTTFKKDAIRIVYVDTLRTNKSAFNFYKKIGFKYRGELFDSVILSLKI